MNQGMKLNFEVAPFCRPKWKYRERKQSFAQLEMGNRSLPVTVMYTYGGGLVGMKFSWLYYGNPQFHTNTHVDRFSQAENRRWPAMSIVRILWKRRVPVIG